MSDVRGRERDARGRERASSEKPRHELSLELGLDHHVPEGHRTLERHKVVDERTERRLGDLADRNHSVEHVLLDLLLHLDLHQVKSLHARTNERVSFTHSIMPAISWPKRMHTRSVSTMKRGATLLARNKPG